ncbi:MAG: hypothetical protein Q4E13_08500 [Clostridia bacterium]|nr:hypothetical protein [Clostridia bacterium]
MEYSYIPTKPLKYEHGPYIESHSFIISADLGQAFDYTAISIIERIVKGNGVLGKDRRGELHLFLRHIERPLRGTEYPAIVDRLLELYKSPQLQKVPKSVVIDLTGLGRPVYDLMRKAGFNLSLNAISITGGSEVTYTNRHYNVPKRDLITNLQVLLQNEQLKIAKGLKDANALIEELANFQTKISDNGKDTYGGRSGVHDDIVLSVAMGAWLGSTDQYVGEGGDRYI